MMQILCMAYSSFSFQRQVQRILCALFVLSCCTACGRNETPSYQGYVEGEYLYLAAPVGGYLKSLDTPKGSRVAVGQAVFAVAADPDAQALSQAEAQAGSAKEKIENLKAPHRASEIAALEANLRAAEAAQRLAQNQLKQQEALAKQNFVSPAKLDEVRSAVQQTKAQVDVAQQQITSFRSTLGRQAEVRAAEADYAAASAAVAQKRWLVERKTVTAPSIGEVAETYYRPGEWVPAGAAVASLLPDTRRRIRFFVPETTIAELKLGQNIEASCDGCRAPIQGKIDFIAAQAEYTPPVIYSRGSREKLVFRIEAATTPEQAAKLRPGLPVDVRLSNIRSATTGQ